MHSDEELAARVAAWRRPHTPGPLGAAELEQFWTQGWVLKDDLLSHGDLQPSIEAIDGIVDDLAADLYDKGLIVDRCEGQPFETRLIGIERQYANASVWLHKQPFAMPAAF